MPHSFIFNFIADISGYSIPQEMNDPFSLEIPEIARVASAEFQEFIKNEAPNWEYDFSNQRGKMFGVLVIQHTDKSFGYLGTMSGVFPGNKTCKYFIPSVFDNSTDDYFINKGMTELKEISKIINKSSDKHEVEQLKETRKQKSIELQRKLFENYQFTNKSGTKKNVLQLFSDSTRGNPPAATGECATPKLLQYAFSNQLKPIAVAEFWWGITSKSNERKHLRFYPACEDKCRAVLEFMLEKG